MDNKKYFVITVDIDGEQEISVKNARELAHLWRDDQDCGYLSEIIAYSFNLNTHEMAKVNVYELATEYLRGEEEVQKEYEDYCETVREYGYDYYENPDNLEMGFDPYMGCYSDDC